jgi:AraC-like DNA-binding protein
MNASPWEFRLQRFTSDDWPAKARLESWRELLSRKLMHAAVTEMGDAPFRVKAAMRELPGVRFGWGSFSPTLHERTREIVARDNDDFFFIVNLEGRFVTTQSRREVSLEPGEATLLACAEIGTYVRPDTGKFMCLRVPCVALTGLVPDAYDRVARVVPRNVEALELLTNYSSALNMRQALATPELRKLAVTHLYDLMALSLGASRDGTEEASVRGLGAARFRAIKTYIAGNLSRQTLSVADVAQQHRLSPRQVQRLFEAAGTTFSEYVQRERLSLVYLALTDPSSAAKGIGDIVLDCGFGDLSHFNRAFRRRYGASPSEVRQYEIDRRG